MPIIVKRIFAPLPLVLILLQVPPTVYADRRELRYRRAFCGYLYYADVALGSGLTFISATAKTLFIRWNCAA